jgi:hypothetical protein
MMWGLFAATLHYGYFDKGPSAERSLAYTGR